MMQLARKPIAFNYSLGTARADLLAGLTVAAISLPQAMAYALIAGIDPRFGNQTLDTAFVRLSFCAFANGARLTLISASAFAK